MIGADADAIRRAEDRAEFRAAMEEIGLRVPRSVIATSLADVKRAANDLGLPLVVRPAFTMGGAGGGSPTTATACGGSPRTACVDPIIRRCSKSRWRAGTSTSSRSCATAPTTS